MTLYKQINSKNEDSSTDISADISFSMTEAEDEEYEDEQAVVQQKIEREFQRWSGLLPQTNQQTEISTVSEREKREKIKKAIKDWTGEDDMETEQIIKNAVKMWKGDESNQVNEQITKIPSNTFQLDGLLYLLETSTQKWHQLWFIIGPCANLLCYRPSTKRKFYQTEFPIHNWFIGNSIVSVHVAPPLNTNSLPNSYSSNIFTIEIPHQQADKRVKHYLAAHSDADRLRWISAIDQAILCKVLLFFCCFFVFD